MIEPSKNFNKEKKYIKTNQSELNMVTGLKNTLEGINSRLDDAEEQISDLKDRLVEITPAEQQKEKKILNEGGLRDLWNNIRYTNIPIIGVPEEKRERGRKLI